MRLIGVCAIALVVLSRSITAEEEPITVMTREGNGATTVRAVRIDAPLRIDGTLDEDLYRRVAPMTGFIQIEPDDGAVASERTELWLAFDHDNVYVSFRVWDSQMDRLVATEMRRDNGIIWSGNDIVVFVFDTFNDRRSAVVVHRQCARRTHGRAGDQRAPIQRRLEPGVGREDRPLRRRLDGGGRDALQVAALPAGHGARCGASTPGASKRSKNEISMLSPVPRAQGAQGVEQTAYAARLLGIEAPRRGVSLDLKPYVTSSVELRHDANPRVSNDGRAAVGFDAKYGVTREPHRRRHRTTPTSRRSRPTSSRST